MVKHLSVLVVILFLMPIVASSCKEEGRHCAGRNTLATPGHGVAGCIIPPSPEYTTCPNGPCVEAKGAAECIISPILPCTDHFCLGGTAYQCGRTGFATSRAQCGQVLGTYYGGEDAIRGPQCSSGVCVFPDQPCTGSESWCVDDQWFYDGCPSGPGLATVFARCDEGSSCFDADCSGVGCVWCAYTQQPCPPDGPDSWCDDDAAGYFKGCPNEIGFADEYKPCVDGRVCVDQECEGDGRCVAIRARCVEPE